MHQKQVAARSKSASTIPVTRVAIKIVVVFDLLLPEVAVEAGAAADVVAESCTVFWMLVWIGNVTPVVTADEADVLDCPPVLVAVEST